MVSEICISDRVDAPRSLLSYRLAATMGGRPADPDGAIAELDAASTAQVAALAGAATLDTVYLLEGRTA